MDANKQRKLVEIGFTIPATCGLCEHFMAAPGAEWGVCKNHQYEHLKHTGPPRDLSVPRSGSCPDWVGAGNVSMRLKNYVVFVQAPAPRKGS